MKRTIALIVSVVMMLAALAACASTQNGKTAYTVQTVNMTYVKSPLNVPSIVEKQRQSFETAYSKLGLGFAYSDLTSGADQTAALASGDIQILNAVGATSVILSAANGADIRIIGMYSTSPKAFRLYSKDASVTSAKDLAGKTIAGPKGTNLHELLASYLAAAGMTIADVNFVSMDIPSAFAALESGSVDCALLAGAVAYNCAAAGYHLVTDGEGLIAGAILTATTQEFYDANKGIIDAFLAVQKDTLTFMKDNRDQVLEMAAAETGLENAAVEDMYGLYDFRMDLTDDDMKALQNTEKFMYDSGLIENEVDVASLVLER